MVLEQLDVGMPKKKKKKTKEKKRKLDTGFTLFTKINSKCIMDYVKYKTI